MKPVGLFPEDPQRFGAFRGADDMVTELRQPLFIELNDHVLVIDEEDAFVPPLFFYARLFPGNGLRFFYPRQIDGKK